jgi:hypothetical protein
MILAKTRARLSCVDHPVGHNQSADHGNSLLVDAQLLCSASLPARMDKTILTQRDNSLVSVPNLRQGFKHIE